MLLAAVTPTLFPFDQYWWFYAAFAAAVSLLLLLDLGVFHREAHVVSVREAAGWTALWVSLALAFNYGFYRYMLATFPTDARLMALPGFDPGAAARQAALEFLAGYVVEYSLSVDNIFVFVVLFGYFQVPPRYQHRVLFYGILGALFFRGLFIAAGALLLRLEPVVWLFGLFLVITGYRVMVASGEAVSVGDNLVVRLFRRFVPVSEGTAGQFLLRVSGRLHATPLFIALLTVELTDVVFAIDSVPAIFALTREPLIVFTSNVLAILGLRSLYFLLRDAVDRFHLLKYGLGIVLIFVGLKMTLLNHLWAGHFPITWSLLFIVGVIGVSVALSLLRPALEPPSTTP
jgi:tellurite resistance protein TerC